MEIITKKENKKDLYIDIENVVHCKWYYNDENNCSYEILMNENDLIKFLVEISSRTNSLCHATVYSLDKRIHTELDYDGNYTFYVSDCSNKKYNVNKFNRIAGKKVHTFVYDIFCKDILNLHHFYNNLIKIYSNTEKNNENFVYLFNHNGKIYSIDESFKLNMICDLCCSSVGLFFNDNDKNNYIEIYYNNHTLQLPVNNISKNTLTEKLSKW